MRFIFPALLLIGCSSVREIQPSPNAPEAQNKEKDSYINRVEAIVSDSASALTVVVPTLAEGTVKGLVEAQVTRLSGIAKPSVLKVEEYARIIKENDLKAIERDKKVAANVDAETSALYAQVEQKDLELSEAYARADAEFKQKVLWMFSCIGGAIWVAGVLILAFSPRKTSGVVLMLSGGIAIGSAWVFDSPWFPWIAGFGLGWGLLDLLIIVAVKTYRYLRPVSVVI